MSLDEFVEKYDRDKILIKSDYSGLRMLIVNGSYSFSKRVLNCEFSKIVILYYSEWKTISQKTAQNIVNEYYEESAIDRVDEAGDINYIFHKLIGVSDVMVSLFSSVDNYGRCSISFIPRGMFAENSDVLLSTVINIVNTCGRISI